MTHLPDENLPAELQEVAARLRRERAEAGPIELDRIKLLAMKRAASGKAAPVRRRGLMRSRLVSPVLAAALLIAGLATIAGTTTSAPISLGGSQASSSKVEYCEPESANGKQANKADKKDKKADKKKKPKKPKDDDECEDDD